MPAIQCPFGRLKYRHRNSRHAHQNYTDMTDVNDDILLFFTCEYCPNSLSPPIKLCTNGHSLCVDCQKKCTCPVKNCTGKVKHRRRSFVLEKIYDKLKVPCGFRKYGCTFKAKGSRIKMHEDKCTFAFRKKTTKSKLQVSKQSPKDGVLRAIWQRFASGLSVNPWKKYYFTD